MAGAAHQLDWDCVLKQIEQALAKVQRALDQATTPTDAESDTTALSSQLAELPSKFAYLTTHAEEVAEKVCVIDLDLQGNEDALRDLVTQTETVRRRLAGWASRAIV